MFKNKYMMAALVAVITVGVFLPALQNGFVEWDDNKYIYDNPFIRSINLEFFRSAFLDFRASNWHPLTWISHALDYALWGLNPFWHHLTNIVFHALNTFIVVILAARLMEVYMRGRRILHTGFYRNGSLIAALTAGLLFGLHPLHVESVVWVSERKDLLCGLFFLLSVLAYTRYAAEAKDETEARQPSPDVYLKYASRSYLVAFLFFALALLSKPMAVSLPFVLLLLDWHPFERIRSFETLTATAAEKLPFFILSIVASALTFFAQKSGGAMVMMESVSFPARLLVASNSLFTYLWKIILPLHLIPFYPYPKDISILSFHHLASVSFVAAVTVISAFFARRQKLWFSVWVYFVITLLPVLGIIQVGEQSMADRYTYLPSLGPFLVVGLAISGTYEKLSISTPRMRHVKAVAVTAAGVMLILLSYLTVQQIRVWKDSITLWTYVIKKVAVDTATPHNKLGIAYLNQNRIEEARNEFEAALRVEPDYAESHSNLGTIYKSQKSFEEAINEYKTAIKLNSKVPYYHYNLGNLYLIQNQLNEAVNEYIITLRLKPDFFAARYNLEICYQRMRKQTYSRNRFFLNIV